MGKNLFDDDTGEVKRYRDSCSHQGIDKQSSYLSMLNI